jgi:hypothetical protein
VSDSSTLPSSTELDRQSGLPTPIEPPRRESAERKPIFHVPHDPVRHFVGRDELLEELRKELSSGRRAALTQAITGLGGIGKTQLAVQYAHRFFADYDVVWWLNAESEMILRAELAALAVPLELPEEDQSDQDRVRLAALGWLSTHDRWLLIFDNAVTGATFRTTACHTPRACRSRTTPCLLASRQPARGSASQLARTKVALTCQRA